MKKASNIIRNIQVFVKKLIGIFANSHSSKKQKSNKGISKELQSLADTLGTTTGELFALSKKADSCYKEIRIPKRSNGFRIIHSPNGKLKKVQKKILQNIISKAETSPYAMAYKKGKNLKDNAAPHINHLYLLKMDISDFFSSITFHQVLSSAFPSTLFPTQCGVILTSLCTKDGVLPQGAPTSPALSNLVMKSFDEHIGFWCNERGIVYTRYCDDLTFSADYPLVVLSYKIEDMLNRWGFQVNKKKTKYIFFSSRQTVTGLCVNKKVSIPSDYKKTLRQDVYYALKFGLEDSMKYGKKNDFFENGKWDTARYKCHLIGKINYILQIEPENKWFQAAKENLSKSFDTHCNS